MMEEEVPVVISIPASVNVESVPNEGLDDIQRPIEDLDFHRISIVESIEPEHKGSHVCIFPNCKKGKRGGTEYCIKHKKMGSEEREKLAAKISTAKKKRKATKPQNVAKSDSQKDTIEEDILVENVVFTIDESSTTRYINPMGLILVLLAFFLIMVAIKSNSDNMCWLSGLCFVVGTIILVVDSPSPAMSFAYFFISIISYYLFIIILLESHLSGSFM